MKKLFILSFALTLLWSCGQKQYSAIVLPETEKVDLDTLVVTAPRPGESGAQEEAVSNTLPIYNPSHKRESDLLHTKLNLHFDWEKERVSGKATLTLKPYFYPTDKVTLDAKGFEFHKVTFEGLDAPLKYDYDGQQVVIHLGETFKRNQQYTLFIDYSATPSESGGSAAITSDKGLFFINPRGEEVGKPQQIWTQGETENNSRWFPTIDKPNERCTQEMYLTVEDRFKTLSNGILVSSKENGDGTRTDYWKMDMPHAPYLFMIAIGEYAVVHDEWDGKPVDYYVEPEYEKYARQIFPHTPQMLQFFSDKLGVKYPWPAFSQVVVRDYVSGAMENTTAVVFGEFMQATEREMIDNLTNENVVAHEMFHHWFGDYVTCESWANLTLNEGFANYSEYLWLEHQYGRDEAGFHHMQELQGYLQSARQQGIHPLAYFGYDDKEDMFDAHSYNKGGLVLHMLRNYVGDDAFFAGLKKYLNDNALSDVEGHELRLAFEDVTGEDLNWFFNQWFYSQGQPELTVDYDYDSENKEVVVTVAQTQDPKEMPPIFVLPTTVDIYANGEVTRHGIRINERKQTFLIPSEEDPELIVFDGDGALLATTGDQKSTDEYIAQYELAPNFQHRMKALQELAKSGDSKAKPVFRKAMDDDFWFLRMFAANNVKVDETTSARLAQMAAKDPHSNVRRAALKKLGETGDAQYIPLATGAIDNDPATGVVAAGLDALLNLDKEAALAKAKAMESLDDGGIIATLAEIYAGEGDPARLPYFEEKLDKMEGFAVFGFIEQYTNLAKNGTAADIRRTADKLQQISMNEGKMFWLRFVATKSINDLHASLAERAAAAAGDAEKAELAAADAELVILINTIKAWEKNERVKAMYGNFPDPPVRP
jgi:aminopeptidase N